MTEKESPTTSAIHPIQETTPSRQTEGETVDEQRRLQAIQRVGLAVTVIAGLAFAANVVLFFRTQAWQMLAIAGLIAVGGEIFYVAQSMVREGRLNRASSLMIGSVIVLIPALAFFWAGIALDLAIGTLVLSISLAILVLPRRQLAWAVLASLSGAGLTFIFDLLTPLSRLDVSHDPMVKIAVLGSIGLAVLLILWPLVSLYRNTQTIRLRLIMAFAAITLLTAVAISAGSIVMGFQSGQQQVINQLELVATLREAGVNAWTQDLKSSLGEIQRSEAIKVLLRTSVNPTRFQRAYEAAYSALLSRFQATLSQNQDFEELLLMNERGQVILSTDLDQESQSRDQEVYFQRGLEGPYLHPASLSPTSDRMLVTIAHPVSNDQGEVIGVLAARVGLDGLNQIMREPTGLGATGETYLVGTDHTLLTESRSPGYQPGQTYVHTTGANAALSDDHLAGSSLYDDYRGVPTIGVYRWLPELQVALIAEQEQSEALRSIYGTLAVNVGIALLATLTAIIASLFITRSIATPLANLTETATQIAAGNLDRTAAVKSEDEIGTLAQAFNSMTRQLRDLISSLEQRVANRTQDLERRAIQLQAAAEVGQAATSIRDLDQLLNQVTHLISERFDLYQVGIFLLDEAGEYAVLRAANSEGGQRMLARGHRLLVGAQGIVGYVTGTGEPRIALDVGADAVHFDTPELPDTRSELALPLVAAGRILGALDVQSTQEAAFSEEDIAVLQVLADQIAVAIENARLFAETQEALEAARRAYGELSREAWTQIFSVRPTLGYLCDSQGYVRPVTTPWQPEMIQTGDEGETVEADGSTMAVPIKIRDHVLGVVRLRKPEDAPGWAEEETALIKTLIEQLSVALESARLHQDTQRRAERERLTSHVTARMRETLDMEAVLKTAVQEIRQTLGLPEVVVRLAPQAPFQAGNGNGTEQSET